MLHVELDSDDGDQVYFRQTHPDLAAKGDREYSLDAVLDKAMPGVTSDQQHALIQFYDGEPSYDTVRDRILAIAGHAVEFERNEPPQNAPPQEK
ncbi:MAG: hypothetical protein WBE72_19330 [Terracidiphilus sp.]